jgi:hypothetical protein
VISLVTGALGIKLGVTDGDGDAVKGGAVASELSAMEKERENITLQPNIYSKENEQHQIENQRLSCHPFGL